MKTIVLVDMDGVITDFDLGFAKLWQKKYPDLPVLDQSNRKELRIEDEFPESLRAKVRDIYVTPGFYMNLPVLSGAVEGINEITEHGFDVWICTSPLIDFENCVLEKYQWIEKHLGRKWTEKIILTRNKCLIIGDWLIDDYPQNSNSTSKVWKQILFDAPYNRMVDGMIRMKSWAEWRDILVKNIF